MDKKINLYHFFAWSNAYSWQHLGYTDGYTTYKESHEHNYDYINCRKKYKIMKLTDVTKKV